MMLNNGNNLLKDAEQYNIDEIPNFHDAVMMHFHLQIYSSPLILDIAVQ